jgi:lipoprotein-anchoring transpeptidase ErfK/SrfK
MIRSFWNNDYRVGTATRIFHLMITLIGVAIVLAAAGCVQESRNGTTAPASNTNATSNAPPTAEAPPPKAEAAPPKADTLTLPVLDAFFAQESFADELKAKLQLTDSQVNQLRAIARQETSKLRESANDDQYTGSAAAARQKAIEQIRTAIGAQKSDELQAFVNERWNGGATAAATPDTKASAKSSSIPADTRVVVNAPAFRMDVFEDGRLSKSYKIGIGYPEFPLPIGLRKAETIIFNPSWTPPDEPWVESGNSKVKVGEKVAAGDKLNPLGPIKIPIGLPSLIHGGKAPAKLGGFASHGCVGLTTPQIQDFAARLAQLSGTQLTPEQFAEYLKHKTDTKPVKLARPVTVELRYDTITVEDGKLHIYRDVYERGTNTEENLRAVLQSNGMSFDKLSDGARTDALRALNAMSRNAGGKPVTETDTKPSKNKNSSGKVTRLIKGAKEAVIDIPELAGKGYPAAVDLDTGVPPKAQAPRPRKRR